MIILIGPFGSLRHQTFNILAAQPPTSLHHIIRGKRALPVLHSVPPVASVGVSVLVAHHSVSASSSSLIISDVAIAIRPGVLAMSIELILLPFSFVSLSSLGRQSRHSLYLIVFELSLICAAILHKSSSSVPLSLHQITLIN